MTRSTDTAVQRGLADAADFARARLAGGVPAEAVADELRRAGWTADAAWAAVDEAAFSRPPAPRALWLLIASIAVALVVPVTAVVLWVGLAATPGGPRALLELLGGPAAPIGPFVVFSTAVWIISTTLLITHLALRRGWALARRRGTHARLRAARTTLLVLSWISVVAVPVLVVVLVIVYGLVTVSLGVMCGEAVSADCGL